MPWMPLSIETLAPAVDHTLLDAAAPVARIDTLCDQAVQCGFAAVCLYPRWVGRAAARVTADVVVCTVAGFPHGLDSTSAKAESARSSVAAGASEIDVVMAWQLLREGDVAGAAADVDAVVAAVHEAGGRAKVIVEASQLSDDELRAACDIVAASGAEFAKTSTGFVGGGATVHAVATMRAALPVSVAVKASGGIRTADAAQAMLEAGATRLGTSSGVEIVRELAVDAVA